MTASKGLKQVTSMSAPQLSHGSWMVSCGLGLVTPKFYFARVALTALHHIAKDSAGRRALTRIVPGDASLLIGSWRGNNLSFFDGVGASTR